MLENHESLLATFEQNCDWTYTVYKLNNNKLHFLRENVKGAMKYLNKQITGWFNKTPSRTVWF